MAQLPIDSQDEKKVLAATSAIKALSISKFILLFESAPKQITYKIENCSAQISLEMLMTAFAQTIKVELSNHPEYSNDYANIYRVLLADFQKIVTKANDQFTNFRAFTEMKKDQKK